MKTIGLIIKEARARKKLSFSKLEKEIKIKKNFLQAIEKEEWNNLPEFPVVMGFVKNISQAVGLDEEKTVAVLRRDYPPKSLAINPKPDISKTFIWSPKLTFLVGIIVVLMIVLGYLAFQYFRFVSPPSLSVSEPKENQVVTEKMLEVSGKTDTDATIKVDNQPAIVDADGNFKTTIEINDKTVEIEVIAVSRSGKESTVRRTIKVRLND
jgi:cytoskeletal protein RodZ